MGAAVRRTYNSGGSRRPRLAIIILLLALVLTLAGRTYIAPVCAQKRSTAINVDPNSSDSIVNGMSALVRDITKEYVKDNSTGYATLGGFSEKKGVSWFGSAIIWGAVYQFSLQTGITKYDKEAEAALKLASYNDAGSLLGSSAAQSISETLEGKWNDDIGWWMRAFIIGTKKYGCNKTTTKGITYCDVAKKTFEQITSKDQIDESKCGYGVYWSRNRKAPEGAYYKSTITNTIAVGAGAYLYSKLRLEPISEKNKEEDIQNIFTTTKNIEHWLISTGLVAPDYKVYDGLDASKSCTILNKNLWSYNAGTLISAFVELISADIDVPWHSAALDKLTQVSIDTFSDPIKGLPQEKGCYKKDHPSECNRDVSSYMSVFVVSLSEAYHVTKNEDLKKRIAAFIDAGLNEHLKSCSSKDGCSAFFDSKPLGDGDNFNAYNNLSALSFLLAKHSVMNRGGPPAVVDSNANKPRKSSATMNFTKGLSLASYVIAVLVPVLIFGF